MPELWVEESKEEVFDVLECQFMPSPSERESIKITAEDLASVKVPESVVPTVTPSSGAKLIKPDPRIFALFLERIHRTADECVYIDDSAVNVAAADRLGFKAIHFASPKQLAIDLRQLGLLRQNGHGPIDLAGSDIGAKVP